MSDLVNNPKHYGTAAVECIEVTHALNFCIGNAFKYAYRFREKAAPLQDLQKARWYIDREIKDREAEESWKEFPSDTRYEISSAGQVRYKGKMPRKLVGLKNGYLTFVVSQGKDKYKCFYAHRAVAETFLPPDPAHQVVCHLNGNKHDNRVANLKWGSMVQNADHRHLHGTAYVGDFNPAAKITLAEALEIRESQGDVSVKDLCAKYGLSEMSIYRIWNNISWSTEPQGPEAALALIVENEPDADVSAAMEHLAYAQWGDDPYEDLKKARWYLDRLISKIENNS